MPGKHGSGLSQAAFTKGFLDEAETAHLLDAFGADGSVCEVLGRIGDGKEATVYAVRTAPETGVERAVAKVYRAQRFRAFAGVSSYGAAQGVGDARARRAIEGRTRRGRLMSHHLWVEREWETLCRLFDAEADVPEPYAHSQDAILMEWIGDENDVAPQLRRVKLDAASAQRALDALLRNVEILLSCDRVHGDLSPYNVLWHEERPWLIDLPQAVDARTNPDARRLLERDVRNVCLPLVRAGAHAEPARFARELWQRYVRGVL